MDPFRTRSVLITGGASGIGRALARALAARGAAVTVADLNREGAESLAAEIGAEALVLDVTDAKAVQRAVDGVIERHGRIDYLFNNAGIAVGGEARYQSLEDWKRVLDVNLMGVVYGTHAAYPRMVEQGSGHIVNTASLAGLVPSPGLTPYSASKHAVVGLSLSLRAEGADLGVRVTALCPGFVDTAIIDSPLRGPLQGEPRKLVDRLGLVPAETCAESTLEGVRRNRALIVLPGYARLAWRAMRWFPDTVLANARRTVERVRRQAG